MKSLAKLCIVPLLLSSALAVAQTKSIQEANDHYKKQQATTAAKKQQDNRSVDRNIQQQRTNAARPTSTPSRPSYVAPKPSYTPPPKPSYTPPATTYKKK